jgi:hypothetical protein
MFTKFALAFVALTSIAHADGNVNVVVTKIKTIPISNESCIKFQTAGGPTWYGLSTNASDEPQSILNTSRLVKFPVSFMIGAPTVDCPDVNQIYGLTW